MDELFEAGHSRELEKRLVADALRAARDEEGLRHEAWVMKQGVAAKRRALPCSKATRGLPASAEGLMAREVA